jgi:protein SCO1/2
MCKVYRVYFSTPPKAKATDDYLVDHSIYFYLLDPDGAFVEAFGKDVEAAAVAEKVEGFLEEWKEHARLAARLG